MSKLLEQIDDLLPQTQCGLCGYKGCRPYATAIVMESERIDRCPPGGVATLNALAELLDQDPLPLQAEMAENAKLPMLALIREDECIGCTKCIQACPVDAIVGSAKLMHTVITDECTGCNLCVEPCPVDCIEMVEVPAPHYNPKLAKQRHQAKLSRQRQNNHSEAKITSHSTSLDSSLDARQTAIQAALARFKAKKPMG